MDELKEFAEMNTLKTKVNLTPLQVEMLTSMAKIAGVSFRAVAGMYIGIVLHSLPKQFLLFSQSCREFVNDVEDMKEYKIPLPVDLMEALENIADTLKLSASDTGGALVHWHHATIGRDFMAQSKAERN